MPTFEKFRKIYEDSLDEEKLKKGDKVKTSEGNIETVMKVEPSRIITYESAKKNNWWHPTKVQPMKEEDEAEKIS